MQAFWRLEVGITNISVSPKPSHTTGASRAVVIVRTLRLSFDQLQTTDQRFGLGALLLIRSRFPRQSYSRASHRTPRRSAHRMQSIYLSVTRMRKQYSFWSSCSQL